MIIWGIVTFTGLILLLIFLVWVGAFGKLPNEAELKQIRNNTATEIITVDNRLLGRFYYQNRTNTSYDELPKSLLKALIATEDIRFFKHNGIDKRSLLRVLVKTILLQNESAGGGSTITQQLAKNLYPRENIGKLSIPVSKIREMIIAKRIEKLYSKNDILEMYLNTVPFGENTFGIETASLVYFNKKPSQLRVEESALLVGLLKANTTYNPRKSTKAALDRRNTVIGQLEKYNYLTSAQADSLKKLPIRLRYRQMAHNEGPAPYLREYLRRQVNEILKNTKKEDGTPYNLYADGLRIYVTINATLQDFAEKSVKEHLTKLQRTFDNHWRGREPWKKNPYLARMQIEQSERYKGLVSQGYSKKSAVDKMKQPTETNIFDWDGDVKTIMSPLDSVLHHFKTLQTGFLAMNSVNGDILAWVGGSGFKYFKYDHVLSKRQVGSTFKPIVYAAALANGKKPCDFIKNDSVVYEEYDDWCPQNANGKYGGYYSIKGALANSINTVSAKLILETGIDNVIDLAHNMGINSELPEVPSLALGTGEVSLYEMVQAYCVFLNNGCPIVPRLIRRIENAEGEVLYVEENHVPGDTILPKEVSQTMLAMLKGVVDHGTAGSLRYRWGMYNELAGKTGTTQKNTDGWFIVCNPKMVVGAWVGGDNPIVRFRSMTYGQGGYMALPITARFLQKVYGHPQFSYMLHESFNIPQEIYDKFDCKDYNEDAKDVVIDIFKNKDIIQNFIRNIFKRKKKKKNE